MSATVFLVQDISSLKKKKFSGLWFGLECGHKTVRHQVCPSPETHTGWSGTSLGLVSKECIHPFHAHQGFLRNVTKKDIVLLPEELRVSWKMRSSCTNSWAVQNRPPWGFSLDWEAGKDFPVEVIFKHNEVSLNSNHFTYLRYNFFSKLIILSKLPNHFMMGLFLFYFSGFIHFFLLLRLFFDNFIHVYHNTDYSHLLSLFKSLSCSHLPYLFSTNLSQIAICLVLCAAEFNQGRLCDHGFGAIRWSLMGSAEGTQLKTVTIHSLYFSSKRWGPKALFQSMTVDRASFV